MQTRSAFIAIIGRANVGKSSLLNALINEKIAIVTDKPQTTRTRITGVLTLEETQYVFVDTPGMHQAKNRLSEHMVKAVHESIGDVDAALLVVDAVHEPGDVEKELMESLSAKKIPAVLILNKIDLLENKTVLIERIAQYTQLHAFAAVIPVSALQRDGVERILDELSSFTEEGPHYFPGDTLTDQPERVIAAEILREKLLLSLSQEVPHGIAVSVERMAEREDRPILDMDAIIYCEKASHKGMVIGKNGTMLKRVASAAREDLERFFDTKVNLQCWVKVKEDWRNREGILRSLGL